MKNIQTLLLKFILISGSLTPVFSFASEKDEIWSYVFLIPIYFILAAQALLVLLAMLMKQFKKKQHVLLSISIAAIMMLIGLGISFYLQPLDKLWSLFQYYGIIGIIVFALPVIQFTVLQKAESDSTKIE